MDCFLPLGVCEDEGSVTNPYYIHFWISIMLSGLLSKSSKWTITIETDGKRKQFKLIDQNGDITKLTTLYDKEDVKGKVTVNLGSPKIT